MCMDWTEKMGTTGACVAAGFDGSAGADFVTVPTRPLPPRGLAKPPPVFRSLASDGKAAPKRRLSKFGTPDVERPAIPQASMSRCVVVYNSHLMNPLPAVL